MMIALVYRDIYNTWLYFYLDGAKIIFNDGTHELVDYVFIRNYYHIFHLLLHETFINRNPSALLLIFK